MKGTKISQSSGPTNLVKDETVYKEWEDRMERAATNASSSEVEQDSGNINRTQSMATLNEPLPQGTGSGSGPRQRHGFSGKVIPLFETMMVNTQEEVGEGLGLYIDFHHTPTDTQLSSFKPQKKKNPKRKQRQATEVHSPSKEIPVDESITTPSNDPLPSEEAKIAQAKEISKLKKRVKKLDKRRKSRPAGGKCIKDIDQDADIALVDESQGRMHDVDIFGVDDLEGNEVIVDVREKIVEKEVSTTDLVTTAGEVVSAGSVEDSDAPPTATTADVDDELTLVKTLIAIKAAKPKVILTAITTPRAKDQISLDEKVVRRLKAKMKAKMEEEERIAREKDEANRAVIKEWDDVQATIDAGS
nr:hypothetical protein [Tanacetum cinerariifolium]